MGAFSIWHWLILLVVVLVLFGGSGKISSLMGDVAKGIKSFKKGLADDVEEAGDDAAKSLKHDADDVVEATKAKAKSKAG